MEIFVDGDACPVKDEALRVAERHNLTLHLVSNSWLRFAHDHPLVKRVVVAEGPDVADDWIVEHIQPGDIAITGDIPLAARCVEKGARAIGPSGKPFTPDSIGMTLAMRDLMTHLRETGEMQSRAPSISKQDKSRFLCALEEAVQAGKRGR